MIITSPGLDSHIHTFIFPPVSCLLSIAVKVELHWQRKLHCRTDNESYTVRLSMRAALQYCLWELHCNTDNENCTVRLSMRTALYDWQWELYCMHWGIHIIFPPNCFLFLFFHLISHLLDKLLKQPLLVPRHMRNGTNMSTIEIAASGPSFEKRHKISTIVINSPDN